MVAVVHMMIPVAIWETKRLAARRQGVPGRRVAVAVHRLPATPMEALSLVTWLMVVVGTPAVLVEGQQVRAT